MKKYSLSLAFLALFCWSSQPASSQVSNDNEDGVNKVDQRFAKSFVPGQVLVKMKDGSPASVRRNARGKFQSAGLSQLDAVLKEFGIEAMEKVLPNEKPKRQLRKAKAYNGDVIQEHDLSQLYLLEMDVDHVEQTTQLVERLNTVSEVEYAEPNYKVYIMDTNIADSYDSNPFVTEQWYLDDYGVKELWDKPVINPKRPVIAIIDTGVDMTHPDLVDNLWTNTAEAEGEEGYDNDGNGFNSDVHGWDFINNTGNVRDNNMHGTHVAGIAAAANNGIGIIGANPQALIMPVSVMQSDGTGDVATIVRGIDYAVQNGADVLNLSLGTYANSRAMRQALEKAYQSAVIVAAAGNDRLGIYRECGSREYKPMFPAAYSFVLGVQATNQYGSLASFSNYDCDGPNYSAESTFLDSDGFNYELKAPGTNIFSAIPGGKYKVLNGTSMASPLVAGAISALMMVKEYDMQEILWADLLHTDNIAQAFAIINRPADLDLIKVQLRVRKELADETEEEYGGDNEIDAGETVSIYPVIRTIFGEASNIKMHLEVDEFEDPNMVEILTGEVNFGMHLDAYGKGVSLNPLEMKIADNIADNRHVKLKVVATCDESTEPFEWQFTVVVTNMVKIGGVIAKDMTLTADHEWLVSSSVAIPSGVTVTIEPGTTIRFNENTGISNSGVLIADGTPEKPILMLPHAAGYWNGIIGTTLRYCKLKHVYIDDTNYSRSYEDCDLSDFRGDYQLCGNFVRTNITDFNCSMGWFGLFHSSNSGIIHSNIINNIQKQLVSSNLPSFKDPLPNNNWINTYSDNGRVRAVFGWVSSTPYNIVVSSYYFGTSREDLLRPYIYELGNTLGLRDETYAWYDLTNMLSTPVSKAHGIVWKVCVNGKDAQDEFEALAPLGVGRHKFEVYYNRPMNVAVAPQISFGVREPYTQHEVAEDGEWSADSLIYTAYVTITGKTASDGLNRIYVQEGEDNEHFEIPYEKTRFNITIQAAGSMATGFVAEAGMGKVNLTWNNDENDFDDAMGFNIYRYTVDGEGKADTLRINTQTVDVETTEYTDYDVTPGKTYYYYYKVLSTDLQEYDVSNVVAATPLTATLGDANGSGDVDVADVITTVNQITGMEPKPFIFEAADVNVDLMIDVLDVIGIIQKILNPGANTLAMSEAEATYTIEDGTLYVESPVALAGVQVQLSGTSCLNDNGETINDKYTVAADLDGFEHTSAWLSDNDYLFLAYNMNGKTLSPGKHALLYIGDAMIAQVRLSDANGHNILVNGDDATKVNRMASEVMTIPGIYDMQGRKLSGNSEQQVRLPKGVYIINGQKVVR